MAPGDPGPFRKRGALDASTSTQAHPPAASAPVNRTEYNEVITTSVSAPAIPISADRQDLEDLPAKVSELSIREPKWEFGTTRQEDESDAADAAEFARLSGRLGVTELPSNETQGFNATQPGLEAPPVSEHAHVRLSPLHNLIDPSGLPPTPVPASATALYAPAPAPVSPGGDEFRVKDYGYGFGRPRNTLSAPSASAATSSAPVVRDERQPKDVVVSSTRPRRGSYNGGEPYERGGYSGRRGRGRGYRGRGTYGDGYNAPRGSRGAHQRATYAPPYDMTTYYMVPSLPTAAYAPGYEMFGYGPAPAAYAPAPTAAVVSPTGNQSSAPVPNPITKLGFPLDALRYYLLGQLEYYLSEDNLAHDLYLRQRVCIISIICFFRLTVFIRLDGCTRVDIDSTHCFIQAHQKPDVRPPSGQGGADVVLYR